MPELSRSGASPRSSTAGAGRWWGEVAIAVAWFVVLGVLGAVVWWLVTPLAQFTRTSGNALMGQGQLSRLVARDGWYAAIAGVGGLVSGLALVWWRRRAPLLTVVLVALGSALAGYLMLRLGLVLGPADPARALQQAAVGQRVPVQLSTMSPTILLVWPLAGAVGSLAALWSGPTDAPDAPDAPDVPEPTDDEEGTVSTDPERTSAPDLPRR